MEIQRKICVNIDFDGTCVTHSFPSIGKDIGAVPVLKKLTDAGHKLILFTMRSNRITFKEINHHIVPDIKGTFLNDAIQWFIDNDIPLYAVQSNPDQHNWTESPKSYAELMIDDSALGCPLKYDESLSTRPFVDWEKVEELLIEKRII
jgi:hypothetical protein